MENDDYPRTILELEQRFPTDESCRDYLKKLRWASGYECPRCGSSKSWEASRGRIICQRCRHQSSVTAGTIFQDTHKPLTLWFRAIWQVTSQKNGASAATIHKVLGLGSYATAWIWMQKLRRAMVRPGRDQLHGRVEVDETYLGAHESGVDGRQTREKCLVAIAAEDKGRAIGRIRLACLGAATRKCLFDFMEEAIAPGTEVHTDGFPAYRGMEKLGFTHDITPLYGNPELASELLPKVHRVASLLKRWLLGTHQGAVSKEHLPYYLDEFTFRFNRRSSRSRGKLFFRLLQQAVQIEPIHYNNIKKGVSVGQRPSGGVN